MVIGDSTTRVLSQFYDKESSPGEAMHVLRQVWESLSSGHADVCTITRDASLATLSLTKIKNQVASIQIQNAPLHGLLHWLAQRSSLIIAGQPQIKEVLVHADSECDFQSTIPFGKALLDVRVERRVMLSGKERCVISLLAAHNRDDQFNDLEFEEQTEQLLNRWEKSGGAIAVATHTPDSVRRFFYTHYDSYEVSSLKEVRQRGDRVFILSDGHDAFSVAEHLASAIRTQFIGSLACALVPKVCGACGKQEVTDLSLLNRVPAPFKEIFESPKYSHGRGCVVCGYHGTHGVVLVSNAVNDLSVSPFSLDAVWEIGTRPLIFDAHKKAASGLISLESAVKLGVAIPEQYASQYRVQAQDVFDKPLTGADAFRGGERRLSKKPTVLVVEDDPDQRAILEMVFKSANYEVESAANGYDALTHVRESIPDIIVSDLMMPKIDGAQLLKQLKSNPLSKNIPVLILTVLTDSNKEYDLLDLGADDYCEKTIQRKILLKRVDNLLKRTRGSVPTLS